MGFKETIQQRYGLSTEAADELLGAAERIDFGKKELVVGEGLRDDYTWFVESGSVRGYAQREEKCIILLFALEGDAASLTLGTNVPATASYTIETMEPSTLLRIPRERMEDLFARSAELANWGRRMAERLLRTNEEYFADYAWQEKGEQYRLMLRRYPELLQRVPLKDLAAYLFVTPQTLSRIRAGLRKRKLP